MRIETIKYKWADTTDDVDINFFSNVTPQIQGTIDLNNYYIKDTMSYKKFTFEEIDENNVLYGKYSNYSFQVINISDYDSTNLIEWFEIFNSNKFIKWKVNYYDDNNNLLHKGYIYRDGVVIDEISNSILSITVISEDKEFKDFFGKKELVSPFYISWIQSDYEGLKYAYLNEVLQKNFPNVTFAGLDLHKYYMADRPYTYAPAPASDLGWGAGNTVHIRTGYNSFVIDVIDRFNFLESLLLPMGWVWYFYNGNLVIQERAAVDYEILELDYRELQISQSVTHNYSQFQVDNIIIDSGEYFGHMAYDRGGPYPRTYPEYNASNVFIFSETNPYQNIKRPFREIQFNSGQLYTIVFNNHSYSLVQEENKFYLRDFVITYDNSLNGSNKSISYSIPKTLRLSPYVTSRNGAGGMDFDRARISLNGNFIVGNKELSNSQFGYTGTVAQSVFKERTETALYQNYESYAQTENFKRNFRKFLRTNDNLVTVINVKQVISNPLHVIKIINSPYTDNDKLYSILELEYDDVTKKDSKLTLQMI